MSPLEIVEYTITDQDVATAARIAKAGLSAYDRLKDSPLTVVLACVEMLEVVRKEAGGASEEADELLATLLAQFRRMNCS